MKSTDDLLAEMKAARDHHRAEAEKLDRAIAALEGTAPAFVPLPAFPAWPPQQPAPWIVRPDHGGMCACPTCSPPFRLGEVICGTSITTEPVLSWNAEIHDDGHGPMLWRDNGVSDLIDGSYHVGTPLLSAPS